MIKIIMSILLITCLFDMPYGYYQFARYTLMVFFLIYAINEEHNWFLSIFWGCSAILINPIFQINLGRPIWNIMDIIWAITLLYQVIFSKRGYTNNNILKKNVNRFLNPFKNKDIKQVSILRSGVDKWNAYRDEERKGEIHKSDEFDLLGNIIFRTNLMGQNLLEADLSYTRLSYTNLSGSNLSKVDFSFSILFFSNFKGADLSNAKLFGAELSGANFSGANLSKAYFRAANKAFFDEGVAGIFYRAGISKIYFPHKLIYNRANFSGANLSEALFCTGNFSKHIFIGANLTNAYLDEATFTNANFTGANFTGASLIKADLSKANLTGANFSGANLYEADLSKANLTGANFTGAYLTYANLKGANTTMTDFTGANMAGSNR